MSCRKESCAGGTPCKGRSSQPQPVVSAETRGTIKFVGALKGQGPQTVQVADGPKLQQFVEFCLGGSEFLRGEAVDASIHWRALSGYVVLNPMLDLVWVE